jgi:hypothetical protein
MCPELHEWIKTVSDVWLAAVTTALAIFTFGLVRATQALFTETKVASKRQLGVNTWLHFIDRWDSPVMHKERKGIADDVRNRGVTGGSDPILDFFEQVGTVYRLDCVEKELCDSSFSHDAENWWAALEERVGTLRKDMKDDSVYNEYEAFVKALRAENPGRPLISPKALEDYLQGEIEL